MITLTNDIYNIVNSVYFYINNQQFISDSKLVTLSDKYPGLVITLGYPKNLKAMTLPTLALSDSAINPKSSHTFSRNQEKHNFSIYGFCGNQVGGEADHKQKFNLLGDLVNLLDPQNMGKSYIDLLDFTVEPRVVLDSVGIEGVTSKTLDPLPQTSLDSLIYRFVVYFNLMLMRDQ